MVCFASEFFSISQVRRWDFARENVEFVGRSKQKMRKSDLELKFFPFGFLIFFRDGLIKNWDGTVFKPETLADWFVSICAKIEVYHPR